MVNKYKHWYGCQMQEHSDVPSVFFASLALANSAYSLRSSVNQGLQCFQYCHASIGGIKVI